MNNSLEQPQSKLDKVQESPPANSELNAINLMQNAKSTIDQSPTSSSASQYLPDLAIDTTDSGNGNSSFDQQVLADLNKIGDTLQQVLKELTPQSAASQSSGAGNDGTTGAATTTDSTQAQTGAASSTDSTQAQTSTATTSSAASANYNPASDTVLQNLSNTGDSQLKQTLLNAWGAVQNGQLSQAGYQQFENQSVIDTGDVPGQTSATYQGEYQTDSELEKGSLNYISSKLSTSDNSALQSIINGQTPSGGDATTSTTTSATTAYNPANDSLLQNLSNTGDSQLKQTLLSAWGDVQNGQLSQTAYSQFENQSIINTGDTPGTVSAGSFNTDQGLEQAALDGMTGITPQDKTTLQNLIGGQGTTGEANTGSSGTTDASGGSNTSSDGASTSTGGSTQSGDSSTGTSTATGSSTSSGDVGAGDTGTGPDALALSDNMGGFGMTTFDASNPTSSFSQEYGVFTADMKLPTGGWPGFWLMSTAHATSGGPASEIDIMEAATAQNPNGYFATLHSNSADHTGDANSDQQNSNNFVTTYEDGTPLPTDLTTTYHQYGVIWPENGNTITYTLDGKAVETVPKYSTTDSSPMMVVLGQGSGDILGQSEGTPGTLDVKSVNVYQYQNLLNGTNDPGGTQYGDGSTITNDGQTLVNTYHQDWTQPGVSSTSIESADGATDGTPWTDHLWFESPGNVSAINQTAA